MQRFVYRRGRVLRVDSSDGRVGYIYAVNHDKQFSTLFAVVTTPFGSPVPSESLASLASAPFEPAYVNTAYGLNGPHSTLRWTQVGNLDVEFAPPTFFFGSEHTGMTIEYPDGTNQWVHGPVNLVAFENEMFARGFIQKVLWLPDDIADRIFSQRPLRWSEHKKY